MKSFYLGWFGLGALFLLSSAPERLSAQARSAPAARSGGAQDPTALPPVAPAADEEKIWYALGVLISRNLDDFQLTGAEFARVKAGLIDGFEHRATEVNLAVDTPKVQALRQARLARTVKKRQAEGQAYLDKAAALPGARRTASGMVMVPIRAGTGASPALSDEVAVIYQGKLIDGTVFDAPVKGGEPAKFALGAVIPCWSEALPLMKVGQVSRIVCPPNLAYGLHGAPPKIASQSTLDFEVELVAIAPQPQSTPTANFNAPRPAADAPAP